MERTILHSDLNSFYASVECLYNPELRNLPVAVCGDPEARHGIVLTKNQIAKSFGVITGQPIWQAKQYCPDLVIVKPNYDRYMKFSKLARDIYADYTDQIEPFGIDECWMDVTSSATLFGNGEKIAETIRLRIFDELGITVSIGVSFNKIFAKLGSDMKKPNAVTVITRDNYKEKVWSLPVMDLLYVGKATALRLNKFNIKTIGQLANCDLKTLYSIFGKVGIVLSQFANGYDRTEVLKNGDEAVIKSIGNSTTPPKDLGNLQDIWLTIVMLSESVAARLRQSGLKCTTVQVSIRDKHLVNCDRQAKLSTPSFLSTEIAKKAMEIFKTKYKFTTPLRTIGVRGCDLVPENATVQLSLLYDHDKQAKYEALEKTIDVIRGRFGHFAIQKGVMFLDRQLTSENPKDEHLFGPVGVLNGPIKEE